MRCWNSEERMPLYEYACGACGQRFEIIQKFSDAPLTTCRLCGKGSVDKLLSSPAIQFKGEGWYVTDYARKGKEEGGKSGAKASNGSDSKPAEKVESKAAGTGSKKDTKPA